LLFTHVRDSEFPVLTNQFGTQRRMAMAFDAEHLDEIADRLRSVLDISALMPSETTSVVPFAGALKSLGSLAPLAHAIPQTVRDGSCQDVVINEPDVTKLPVLTTW